tara:strand:- start:5699 stop:7387 length:1689 start_codon:yes stop_codon:yes gene_type:complete
MSTSIITIPISKIEADPNQPRKSFDAAHLQGLSDSIKQHGVLQPITVKKKAKKFVIIMGERRFRASKLAELKEIPCIVSDMDNELIREVQIIENLQRQDVEPIEEAEAIAYLKNTYSPEEIGLRIGRSLTFIYQRIKLAELIDDFKPLVRSNKITLSIAVQLSSLPVEEQKTIFDSLDESFSEWELKRFISSSSFDLKKAPFNLEDKQLIPSAGDCVGCPFNSANQGNLFGDNKSICTKSSCYTLKEKKSFSMLLDSCKDTKTILVYDVRKYNFDEENVISIMDDLKRENFKIYTRDNSEILTPVFKLDEVQVKKELLDEYEDELKEGSYTLEEIDQLVQQEIEDNITDIKDFEESLKEGYSKALLLDKTNFTTSEIFFKEKSKQSLSEFSVSLDAKKMDECTNQEKIVKIQMREQRKEHITANALFVNIVEKVGKEAYINQQEELSQEELIAFCATAYTSNISYYDRRDFFEGLFEGNNKSELDNLKDNCSMKWCAKIIRYMIINQLHFGEQNHLNNISNTSFYESLRTSFMDKLQPVLLEHQKGEDARKEKVMQRISDLS